MFFLVDSLVIVVLGGRTVTLALDDALDDRVGVDKGQGDGARDEKDHLHGDLGPQLTFGIVDVGLSRLASDLG